MPGVNVGMLDGQLAWRQHDGGHTDGPNWRYFIPWAEKFDWKESVSGPPGIKRVTHAQQSRWCVLAVGIGS